MSIVQEIGVHLTGVYLTGVHLMGVYLMGVIDPWGAMINKRDSMINKGGCDI